MKTHDTPYHYGNLDQELLQAALRQARHGGPDALSLRALARELGVSPMAVYRHYKSQADLFMAVKHEAAEELADFMRHQSARLSTGGGRGHAVARMQVACEAYVLFALQEPGLFRAANNPIAGQTMGLNDLQQNAPFTLFKASFAELVDAGYIRAEDQPAAEVTLWATAHGLATLLLDSPLQQLGEQEKRTIVSQTIAHAVRGIRSSAAYN